MRAHWRPQEEGLVVIDVIQGNLQRLHGLIWHWLAQVAGYQDELGVEQHSQRRRHRAPAGHSCVILGEEVVALHPEESPSLSHAP